MADRAIAGAPQADAAVVLAGGLDHAQRRLLRAGFVLVAGGILVITHGIGNDSATANAEHALAGFLLLLLGVFLIGLLPVADRFPGAARVGAAVADAVLLAAFFFQPAGN
ncbi:unnamed protein product [Urochloa decumbens]|uniref:Uncharacterized protein n=1 Tax=Urochloa decumbens TaxID=240449 RepID=A0ABC9E0A0_9POAL